MTNNNTKSKVEYAVEHIFWGIISMIWFSNILFRNIDGLTYDQSRCFLWFVLILSVVAGIAFTWNKRRNNLSIFVNILMPYELYSLIAYRHTVPVLAWCFVGVSLLLSITYVVIILKPKIKVKSRKKAVIRARLIWSILGSRTVTTCCLSVMILVLGVSSLFGILCFSPSTNPIRRSSCEEVTIAKNIDDVLQLEEEKWNTLSTQDKLNKNTPDHRKLKKEHINLQKWLK